MMETICVNEQISLERIKYTHAFQVFQALDLNRAFLEPWLPFVQQTRCQEDTEGFIRTVITDRKAGGDEVFVLWYRNRFAGLVGLKDTDKQNKRTEIGYWLVEAMTGKGLVTRSVKALLDYLFTMNDMNRVQIKCAVGNGASAAIPKRLGFHFEGIERQGERHGKHYLDLEVYSLLRLEHQRGEAGSQND